LTQEEHNNLISFIAEAYGSNHALMMHDIVRRITEQYGKTMDVDSIRQMLDRDPGVKSGREVPMEEKRVQVTEEDITAYLAHSLKRSKVLRPIPSAT
jgi:hypothetical protein